MALVFPILTQFDDRAAKKADQAFTKLGRKFATVFSVGAVVKFGKAAVREFQQAEKEAAQLLSQLEAINLAFSSDFLNEYIDNLALLSGITGGDLNRAFITLSQGTEDVTTAQRLLNAALDISAGTSKDLQTVSLALQRAYKGEVTALARLRIGYTTADLKGRDFNEVLTELTDKFQGSSARAADTLAGKMARLNEATDQAKEAFGAGFVKGLEDSNVAVEDLQKTVIDLGDAFGYAAGQAISFYQNLITDVTQSIEESDSVFARLVKSLVKNQAAASRLEEERGRATLRQRNAILKAEQKNLKTRKEAAKLGDKEKKDAEKLAKAKGMFDMEQIQIAAALQGQLTEEERTRLQLMKAIIEENAGEADRLTAKLAKLQEDTQRLATSLTTMEAGNPFANWDEYFKQAGGKVDALKAQLIAFYTLANEFLVKEKGVGAGAAIGSNANPLTNAAISAAAAAATAANNAAVTAAANAAASDAVNAVVQSGGDATEAAAAAVAAAAQAIQNTTSPSGLAAGESGTIGGVSLANRMASFDIAEIAAAALTQLISPSALAAEESGAIGAASIGSQATIIINNYIEGNAITTDDLVEVITDQLYQDQKTGKGLLFSAVAI